MFRCRHHQGCDREFATELDRVVHMLGVIIDQGVQIMTSQDNINTDVTALQAFLTDLGTAVTAIKDELAAQNVSVDTSALDALVAQLPAAQASVDALVTTPAAPADPTAGDGSADAGTPAAE